MTIRFRVFPIVAFVLLCAILGAVIYQVRNERIDPPRSNIVVLDNAISRPVSLQEHVRYYVDHDGSASLGDILARDSDDMGASRGIPSFGYTSDVIWYRVQILVPAAIDDMPYLEVQPSFVNRIDAYLMAGGDNQPIWQSHMGDRIPASQRPMIASSHIDRLPHLAAGNYTLVIRTRSTSTQFLIATLWPTQALLADMALRDTTTNWYFGVFLMLGAVYILLGILAQDKAVAAYGFCVWAIGILTVSVKGFVLSVIQPEWPLMNDLAVGAGNTLAVTAGACLWIYILDFRRTNPLLARIATVYCVLSALCALTATNDAYILFGNYVVPIHATFLLSVCLVLVVRIVRDPYNRLQWVYLIVMAVPTMSAVILQLCHAGIIESTPLRLGLHSVTLMFHLLMMGLLMAFRLSRIEHERVNAAKVAAATTSLLHEQRKLISMLSHEFRTPLAAIQRSSELLLLRLKDAQHDVIERLERIRAQARKLARLVDIFLNKDGFGEQNLALDQELVPVNQMMIDFVAQITRADAEIQLECIGTDQLEADLDLTLIGLTLTNMIETARRYCYGRPVRLITRNHVEGMFEIAIPCQGREVTDAEKARLASILFEPGSDGGTVQSALGLHISRRIAEAHGGTMQLRDRGTGSLQLVLLLPASIMGADFS